MFSLRREVYKFNILSLTYLIIAFRRRHHCRICGRIFDDKCTSHIPGSRFGLQEKIRVCNSCNSIMDEYDDLETQENGIIVSKSLANV
jgi:1-phosphatidylinositol-3-phosphate 5-kinase